MQIPEPQHYLARLFGTRPGWPENMTSDEERIMNDHFLYLKDLAAKKKVLLAGPVFGNVFGLIILQVYSEAEALEIMNQEPSVARGVHTYKLHPMRVSLMAHNVPADRYASSSMNRVLYKEITVTASLDNVWNAWTTTEGVKTFFSPDAMIELRVGGAYEIYFLLNNPYGLIGSEDCKILSYLPKQMLSFEWNAPPQFGKLRDIKTVVILQFEAVESNEVRMRFVQTGWGDGEDWDRLYSYFDKAWAEVFNNFKRRFDIGPINWSN
jgi:uncharacterized protein YndB with AHSA1/START domain/uncharacterized protein YciI